MTTLKQAAELCAQEFTVHYEDGSETIWVRTRTMPEVAQAEEEIAARKLALREKYRVGTTHYQAEVSGLEMESYPNLVGIVLSGETESLAERARRAVPMPMRPATYRNGGDSEEKEVREYEERQEKYEGMVAAKLSEILSDRETALLQEPKEKLVKRLGRSPDRGDAVVMAWWAGAKMSTDYQNWPISGGGIPKIHLGRKPLTGRR